jgi:hypothetical protein
VPVNRPRHSELRLDALQLVYSDAYVLVAMLALAAAAASLLRSRRARLAAGPGPAAAQGLRASQAAAG